MITTKYVMSQWGHWAIVSKLGGMEHTRLAQEVGGYGEIASAGFLLGGDHGRLTSYGRSMSLDIASKDQDGALIAHDIQAGQAKALLLDSGLTAVWVVSNHPNFEGEPTTLEQMREWRVIE